MFTGDSSDNNFNVNLFSYKKCAFWFELFTAWLSENTVLVVSHPRCVDTLSSLMEIMANESETHTSYPLKRGLKVPTLKVGMSPACCCLILTKPLKVVCVENSRSASRKRGKSENVNSVSVHYCQETQKRWERKILFFNVEQLWRNKSKLWL